MPARTVLAIDGGGTCGFFSYQILRKLSQLIKFKADLIVGVSAGAILGAALSSGVLSQLDDVNVQLYTLQLFGDASANGPWFGPKYNGVTKSSVLRTIFGDMKFGDLPIPMAIVVDRIGNSPVICRSWDPVYSEVSLVQILDATSAVPVLFPPVTINGEQYIDGGTATSSPICVGHLMGLEFFPNDRICLMSLGTEARKVPDGQRFDNSKMGIIQLISLGLPMKVLTQGSSLVNDLSMNILGPHYIRIEGNISAHIDDTSIYAKCTDTAESIWNQMEPAIFKFLEGCT
jgi:patatin-like phospholipase/acyl hydrolase